MASVLIPEELLQQAEMKQKGSQLEKGSQFDGEEEELDLDDKNCKAIPYDVKQEEKDTPTSDDVEEKEDDDDSEEEEVEDDDSEEEEEARYVPKAIIVDGKRFPPYEMSSSDDEDYGDGYRKITKEELQLYDKMCCESEGFDVPLIPNVLMFHMITPACKESPEYVIMDDLSKLAIQDYNSKEGTNYSFVKVIKANLQGVQGILSYITFEARDADSTQTFQAKVLEGIPDTKVEMCRIKPPNAK